MSDIDQRCVDLAEHFLRDVEGSTQKDVAELSGKFQMAANQVCAAVMMRDALQDDEEASA